ncbi:hypothetical protein EST38_g10630 [Candolleomyces aberdarensis]|uniref:HMG domain-containing protein n=1 Tax=Candolleomyces aberdarensis TaxID=2316362 RepID=A0A4Q2D7L6_9AGAR|nr:hypothetical protein EST38_g10630 [Candolleomyces aberdarensis]
MPVPKRRRLDRDDSPSDSELGWLRDDSDGSDDAFDYPSGLMDEAKDPEWDSPTKALRRYQQPLTRRDRPGRNQVKQVPALSAGVISDSVTPDPDTGPSLLWDTDPFLDDVTGQTDSSSFPSGPTDASVSRYADAVDSFSAGFCHIEGSIFAVEGWDTHREQTTTHWYHLQYLSIQDEIHVACTCPAGLQNGCIHQVFFKTYDMAPRIQEIDVVSSPTKQTPAVVFIRQRLLDTQDFVTMFSIKSLSSSALKGRAIVTHTGTTPSTGRWKCLKDSGAPCAHIPLAKKALIDLLGADGDELDDEDGWNFSPARSLVTLTQRQPVSYLPILPPLAASLKTDPEPYKRPPPYRDSHSLPFVLSGTSSCPCPSGRTFCNPAAPSVEKNCRIYTLHSVVPAQLRLQQCPTCGPSRRRFIGPDLREIGIFNYNNSILVSHELLDEYTMSYVTSETPFTAYVTIVQHRYALLDATFMGIDLFRSIWFSYASLQAFDNDMQCIRCGPTPETTVWDGITLAFGRKHLSSTLSPPTQLSSSSPHRGKVKPYPKPQLLPNKDARRELRAVVEKGTCNFSGPLSDDEDDEDDMIVDESQLPTNSYLMQVNAVQEALKLECPALAALFLNYYGTVAERRPKSTLAVIRNFFRQIGAEESVLQMVNATSLGHIRSFLANPHHSNLSLLVTVPALYKLLELQPTFEPFIPIIHWIAQRASGTLAALTVEPPLQTASQVANENADWKSVCPFSFPS